MHPVWLAVVALLAASCGGSEAPVPLAPSSPATPARASSQANKPPVVKALEIRPESPRSDQPLSVEVNAYDPDHDPLQIEVAWYRNAIRQQRGTSLTLPGSVTTRGDEIHAIVYVSDGNVTVSERSASVRVINQVPRISSIEVLPKEPTAKDELLAVPRAQDPDNDAIQFSYRWIINGKELRDADGPQLEAGRVRRGDAVVVSITGSDGSGESDPFSSRVLRIGNSAPRITSKPSYDVGEGNEYRYQVLTDDPDGDRPLRYQLLSGPPGMTIGLVSGLVSWSVPNDASGKYPVELSVTDPGGAASRQTYVLELRWAMAPANTP